MQNIFSKLVSEKKLFLNSCKKMISVRGSVEVNTNQDPQRRLLPFLNNVFKALLLKYKFTLVSSCRLLDDNIDYWKL